MKGTKPKNWTGRRKNRPGRAIEPGDARRIVRGLNGWAASGSFVGLRTRAIVFLAWGAALRASEVLALDLEQVRDLKHGRLVFREKCYLRRDQAKGSEKKDWSSAGLFVIVDRARAALHAYLRESVKRGWIPAELTGPVFITSRAWHGSGHNRLKYRSHQYAWESLCDRVGLPALYRFHDLRHDAITRAAVLTNGNFDSVQRFGRFQDLKTVSRYVHISEDEIVETAKKAAV